MAIVDRIFAITIMALILAFSIIHLGVSIGIIVPYHKYGDIFKPQIGLSGFNIVISAVGLVTGILGLISILMNSEQLGKVTCLVSGILGIFALASLVTAIVVNAKSLNYVSSHFSGNMMEYQYSPDAKNKIDLLQNKYQCCGTDMWIDWADVGLNVTSTGTNVTNATTTTTTMVSPISISLTTSTSTLAIVNNSINPSPGVKNVKRDITHISNDLHRRQLLPLADYSRKKRQAPLSYGGIEGLPITFGVILPGSCCTSEALFISSPSGSYCLSNANNAVNHFNIAGCAKPIDITAGNQAMGFGVINSFMVVLAFVAIPVMLGEPSVTV